MNSNIEVAWWLSRTGPDTGFQMWKEDDDGQEARPGEARWLRVAATNLGDLVDLAVSNLVAPVGVTILRWDQRTRRYEPPLTGAENPLVGVPPDCSVQFFAAERKWPRGFTWMGIYLLIVSPAASQLAVPLLYEVDGVTSMRRLAVA